MKYIYTVLILLMAKFAFADVLVPNIKDTFVDHPYRVLMYAILCTLPYLVLLPLFHKRKRALLLLCIFGFIMNFPFFSEGFSITQIVLGFALFVNMVLFSQIMPERIASAMLIPIFLFIISALDSWIVLKVKHKNWKYLHFQLSILILFFLLEILVSALFLNWMYY